MFTITDIMNDIQRGITSNNMVEAEFSYRIVYFINYENGSKKHYVDASYDELRAVLENVIRKNLTVSNNLVIAAVTVLIGGQGVSLLSKSYSFNLGGYFMEICGEKREKINSTYGRMRAQWS